jgi:NADPH2:quinone reductase
MTSRMNVIHVTRIGGPEVLQPACVDRPAPKKGEALVRITYAGVIFSDIMTRTAYWRHADDPEPATPFTIGTEAVGRVEAVGPEVKDLEPGQRVGVVMHNAKTYAEFAVLPVDRLIPVPDDIQDQDAAATLVAGLMADMLLTEFSVVKAGTTVLVTGSTGGSGSILVQWAAARGAHVIATVSSNAKVALARQHGAAEVVDLSLQDLVTEVRRTTNGRGVDLAFDAVGGDVFAAAFETLGTRKTIVPYGIAGGKQPSINPLSLVNRSRIVAGLMFFDFVASRAALLQRADAVFAALRRRWIRPDISQVFPLTEAAKAHEKFEDSARTGKILLAPDHVS